MNSFISLHSNDNSFEVYMIKFFAKDLNYH